LLALGEALGDKEGEADLDKLIETDGLKLTEAETDTEGLALFETDGDGLTL